MIIFFYFGEKFVNNSITYHFLLSKTSQINKESFDEKLATIKKKPIKKEEMLLFQPEIVENMINKAKEQWEDKKLSYESHGLIEQQVKGFDLSIENIKILT